MKCTQETPKIAKKPNPKSSRMVRRKEEEKVVEVGTLKTQTLMVPSSNPRNQKEKKMTLQTLEKGKKEKKTLDLSGIPS